LMGYQNGGKKTLDWILTDRQFHFWESFETGGLSDKILTITIKTYLISPWHSLKSTLLINGLSKTPVTYFGSVSKYALGLLLTPK